MGRILSIVCLSLGLAFASPQAKDNQKGQSSPQKQSAASQSGSQEGLTADEQGSSASDREMTRKIRKAVVEDESLSSDAHNVKIITRDGRVTLRGPVRSEAEKNQIALMAKEIAGDGRVDNELTVTPDDSPAKPEAK